MQLIRLRSKKPPILACTNSDGISEPGWTLSMSFSLGIGLNLVLFSMIFNNKSKT